MTPGFSMGDALAAPFRILRRKPLVTLVWGVLMTAAIACIYSLMIPLVASLPIGPGQAETAMTQYMEQSRRLSLTLNGMNVIVYLTMLLVWTAVGRAVLTMATGDRFAFLRIGMDEVRVAVTFIAWFLGWYVVTLLAGLLAFAVAVALWFSDHTLAVVVGCFLGLIVVVASAWLYLRLSLISQTSLILKDFAFAQGWALTKGQVFRLLGLNLLRWLIGMAGGLLLWLIIATILVTGFVAQGLSWPTEIASLYDLAPLARPMAVPGAIALIPIVIFYGWYMALVAVPFMVAARQLLDGGPVKAPDTPPPGALESIA